MRQTHFKVSLALLIAIILLLFACKKNAEERRCFKSNGKQIEIKKYLSSFEKVILNDKINLVFEKDTVNELILNVPENLAPFILTDVSSGILSISNDNICNWLRKLDVEITVFLKTQSLKKLECRGAGDVRTNGFYESDYFEINAHDASGKVDLLLRTKEISVKLHNGPADIYLNGTTDKSYVYNAGSGYIYMQNYDSKSLIVRHKGTGQCHVKALNYLHATLEYEGDIHYYGNPSEKVFINNGRGSFVKH